MSKIAVVGCGVIGLTTAIRLQKDINNVQVTIITEKLSPNTTGDVSAGLWGPYLLGDTPTENIIKWSKISHDEFLKLWKSGLAQAAGISLVPVTRLVTEDKPYEDTPWSFVPFGSHILSREQLETLKKNHERKYTGASIYTSFTCEPTKLLPFLLEEFFENGGNLILKKINNFEELAEYDIIVNCAGPGAKDLVQDENFHFIRGQIVRVKAPWQFNVFIDESDDGNYVIPNSNDVILGGTHQVDDCNLSPDPTDKEQILSGCTKMSPGLKSCEELSDGVGLRPGRTSVRLETEKYITANKVLNIVHNYGHGGAGVTLCYGCAVDASALVQSALLSKLRSHL